MSFDLVHYTDLLGQIKHRIRQGQARAVLSANAEMITTYWDVGKILHERQQQEGWGKAVIPRLAKDIHNELPEVKGFSERNIGRMVAFYRAYSDDKLILPQPVAKLTEGKKVPQLVAQTATPAILQQQSDNRSYPLSGQENRAGGICVARNRKADRHLGI